ncbi:MAG: zf-HC2 domain-containing protein [Candidatus Mariimomonas ferrooxydans]
MECHRIQEKSSAYAENLISSEEKKQIDSHLRTCPKCSLYLEELKKTIVYAQGLEDIEPPPWLAQKVMSRVREESAAGGKGIIQKLFFPLYIKVPIEIIATIAIAVTTLYVYKTIQPEMRLTEKPSQQVIVSEQEEKKSALKSNESFYKDTFLKAPEPAKRQGFEKKHEVIVGKTETAEAPIALTGEKIMPQETDKVLDIEAIGAEKPAPELKVMAERKRDSISLTVNVKDIGSARKEIRKVLIQLKGKVIKTESFEDKDVLSAELSSKKLKDLFGKLRLIGEVKEKDALYALEVDAARFRGDVKIKIDIETGQAGTANKRGYSEYWPDAK